jgi:hypothetical protein
LSIVFGDQGGKSLITFTLKIKTNQREEVKSQVASIEEG